MTDTRSTLSIRANLRQVLTPKKRPADRSDIPDGVLDARTSSWSCHLAHRALPRVGSQRPMELFKKKPIAQVLAEANDPLAGEPGHAGALKRTLGPLNLTALGIGAIIGAGIFSLTGTAAAYYAGPGIVYSFVLGGVLCALFGLCYAEMAAMIPVAGSAYAYAYATLGELVAWIIGWDLILEYAFGAVTVAVSWSGYFVSFLKTIGLPHRATGCCVSRRARGASRSRSTDGSPTCTGCGTCPPRSSRWSSPPSSTAACASRRWSTTSSWR